MKILIVSSIVISILFGAPGLLAQKKKTTKKPKPPIKVVTKTPVAGSVSEWKEFTSVDGKFKVLFPETPIINIEDEGTGEMRLKSTAHRAAGGLLGFALIYTDSFYKVRIKDSETIEELTKLILSKNKLMSRTKIIQNGIEGVEVVYLKGSSNISQHRIFAMGNRYFELIVSYQSTSGNSVSNAIENNKMIANKFFDSFVITK